VNININDVCQIVTDKLIIALNYSSIDQINRGECWLWALLVSKLICSAQIYTVTSPCQAGHVFIRYDDLYYDCETIEGTNSWTSLKYFDNIRHNKSIFENYNIDYISPANKKHLFLWSIKPWHKDLYYTLF